MDLAVYISELLGLEGEVNVPGIGRFAQTRINGYYNEKENKFYPPTHKINFDPEHQADDRLATFISDKKNISLASSKYFIEKYANGLKQQVTLNRVDVAGIGQLYLKGSAIGFSEDAPSKETDPAFFGLKPVNVEALVQKASVRYAAPPVKVNEEQAAPSIADQVMTELVKDRIPPAPPKPTVIEETEVQPEEEYTYEEPVRRSNNIWIAILLILIIALLALLGLYKYKPEWFDRSKDKPQTFVAVDTTADQPADPKAKTADPTKNAATKQDSLAKATALVTTAAVDTDAVEHYEISGGAYKSLNRTYEVVKHYQDVGLHPRVLKHVKGNLYKISLGTYFNKEQGQKAVDSIKTATRLTDILLDTYKPKK